MKTRLLFLILLFITLSACKQTTTREAEDIYPAWVLNPQISGFEAVSASAPKQKMGGDYAQRRVALTKARQQLAEQIRVRVQSIYMNSITDAGGEVNISQSMKTKMRSRVMLNMGNARVLNEWVHPTSGDLYIHYVTDAISGI